MVCAHAPGGRLQGVPLGSRNRLEGGFQFGLGEFELAHGGDAQAVKTRGVFKHRRITAQPHVGQDVGDALLDRRVSGGGPMQARLELGIKSAVCAG